MVKANNMQLNKLEIKVAQGKFIPGSRLFTILPMPYLNIDPMPPPIKTTSQFMLKSYPTFKQSINQVAN